VAEVVEVVGVAGAKVVAVEAVGIQVLTDFGAPGSLCPVVAPADPGSSCKN